MTQHVFSHGTLQVLTGWDRRLGCFFLVIDEQGNDEPIYSNLEQPNPFPNTYDSYKQELEDRKIPIPDGLLLALETDKLENKGNDIKQW